MNRWWLAGLIVFLGLAIGAYNYRVYISVLITQPQMFRAPVLDEAPQTLPADLGLVPILSFSKTNGYRHHESISASQGMLDAIGLSTLR